MHERHTGCDAGDARRLRAELNQRELSGHANYSKQNHWHNCRLRKEKHKSSERMLLRNRPDNPVTPSKNARGGKKNCTFQQNLENQKQLAGRNIREEEGPGLTARGRPRALTPTQVVLHRPAGCGLQFHIDPPTIVSVLPQIGSTAAALQQSRVQTQDSGSVLLQFFCSCEVFLSQNETKRTKTGAQKKKKRAV